MYISDGYKYCLTGERLDNIQCGEKGKLILKPLSLITNEDSNEVSNIFNVDVNYANRIIASLKLNEPIQTSTPIQMLSVYQYLISKGYDIPQHVLGGKTLFEYGLAIYEK